MIKFLFTKWLGEEMIKCVIFFLVDTKIDKEKDVNPHTVGLYDESS
jgi:hypothetical protein